MDNYNFRLTYLHDCDCGVLSHMLFKNETDTPNSITRNVGLRIYPSKEIHDGFEIGIDISASYMRDNKGVRGMEKVTVPYGDLTDFTFRAKLEGFLKEAVEIVSGFQELDIWDGNVDNNVDSKDKNRSTMLN